MSTFVSDLEPRALWAHFDRILTIPRGSKKEDAIRRYVLEVARRSRLESRQDPAGNVVLAKPASTGRDDQPLTVLQSHLDMVQEKNSDKAFDFDRDALVPVRREDWLYADGTTLGSDNGIGVAAMLAVAEATDLAHGPLELLFTIDEETGLTGAGNLTPELIEGRRLLNLDTEEEGALYVGCSGGLGSRIALPVARGPVAGGAVALSIKVAGLKGGHSGVDIHLQRGNAIKLLVRALAAAPSGFRLAALAGGSAHNAIPREATATAVLAAADADAFRAAVTGEFAKIAEEIRTADPDARIEVTGAALPADAWDAATTARAVDLIDALPHGVSAMSLDIPGLVETSVNLATVGERDGALRFGISGRSSVDSAIRAQARRLRAIARLAGAEGGEEGGYPGWKPNLASPLLATVRDVHRRELGSDPEIKAIHAGLETGILGEKVPGMDMISFGPQIEFPHSPDERVHIPSVGRFWKLLTAVLAELG